MKCASVAAEPLEPNKLRHPSVCGDLLMNEYGVVDLQYFRMYSDD